MKGEATGKGLDIKGKSAKTGLLSGYVPFSQIHSNEQLLSNLEVDDFNTDIESDTIVNEEVSFWLPKNQFVICNIENLESDLDFNVKIDILSGIFFHNRCCMIILQRPIFSLFVHCRIILAIKSSYHSCNT